ncbi:uncharacterized protein LOC120272535 [Dioscorea cayenensis subsp. rotundata]|uniref:Uncharacterized protein LOC120272535 n=1 Tax=Dioscorea cayennensis subsp. rotundata TaxID=55577 RepID=A0AB40C929_DIOCR|nr:uncharacterized protein LOC120272535 [Dioscorea cayenensis subsp. rotundata]
MSTGSSNASQPNVLLFRGENYNLWSLKMKAVFRSKDLWSIVEKGVAEEPDNNRLTEIMKKDAKAVCLIQQNLDDRVLLRIIEAKTAKQAWDMLKTHYQGNTNNITVRLHSLHRELDATKMKHGEKIEDYITRVLDVVYQIKMLGEEFPDKTVVTKILRSLTPRFTNVVSSIVEAKDLNTLAIDALCGSLRSHESILNNAEEEEVVDVVALTEGEEEDEGEEGTQTSFTMPTTQDKDKNVQLFHLVEKFGHVKSQCWYRSKEANITEEAKEQDEGLLLWRSKVIQEPGKHTSNDNIRLGDGNLLQVAGIGQLMSSGYKVEFTDGECIVKEVQSNTQVARIPMTSHRLFPLEADDVLAAHVVQRDEDLSTLWHRRYGHLNKRSLNYLNEHKLVDGLPTITHIQPCEACALGKQAHRAFPKGQAYRATTPLELVHGDLVGPMQTPSYGGNLYFFLLIDDFSRHSWVYFLQYKNEALQKFKVFKLAVEKQYSTPVKAFRSDRGREFTSGAFRAFCEETGIKHQLTAPRTPRRHGVAERQIAP